MYLLYRLVKKMQCYEKGGAQAPKALLLQSSIDLRMLATYPTVQSSIFVGVTIICQQFKVQYSAYVRSSLRVGH